MGRSCCRFMTVAKFPASKLSNSVQVLLNQEGVRTSKVHLLLCIACSILSIIGTPMSKSRSVIIFNPSFLIRGINAPQTQSLSLEL